MGDDMTRLYSVFTAAYIYSYSDGNDASYVYAYISTCKENYKLRVLIYEYRTVQFSTNPWGSSSRIHKTTIMMKTHLIP